MDYDNGEVVALVGGGRLRNVFSIVRFKGMKNEAQAILETNPKDLPNPFEPFVTEKVEPLPLAGSTWSLQPLPPELRKLPLGEYCVSGDVLIDITDVGFFGTILDGKVRAKFNREKQRWELTT